MYALDFFENRYYNDFTQNMGFKKKEITDIADHAVILMLQHKKTLPQVD